MKLLFSTFFCSLFLFLSAQQKDSIKVEIKNVGPLINTPYPDYAPLISADGNVMVFTSRRTLVKKNALGGKKGLDNVYVTYYDDKNKKWLVTFMLGPLINLPDIDNSAVALSNDGQRMLLYRGGNALNANGDILESTLSGDEWSEPVRLPPPINSEDNETSASISPDGGTIYFVSDRKGGLGGKDIWYCTQNENGVLGEAINMGPAINTDQDEEAVFIHPNGGVLFFSSKGHNSVGGFDIFMSVFDETTKTWTKAESLGAPINTPDNDIYFVLQANGKTGYYASSKPEGLGELDIYSVAFSEDFMKKNVTLFKGRIVNKNGNPLESIIDITNKSTGKLVGTFKSNKSSGKYLVSLPPGKKYEIEINANGYSTYVESFDIPYKTGYGELIKDIVLDSKNAFILSRVVDEKGNALSDVLIEATDKATNQVIEKSESNSTGHSLIALPPGKTYDIVFSKPSYSFHLTNITIPDSAGYEKDLKDITLKTRIVIADSAVAVVKKNQKDITKDIVVEKKVVIPDVKVVVPDAVIEKKDQLIDITSQKIEEGQKIVLNDILFDFNKSKPRKESVLELEHAIKLVNTATNMIEISGHTDNVGTRKNNRIVSEKRAKMVANYLIKNGVDKNRVTYKGYGESQPITSNATAKGRQMNRRTEIKILKTGASVEQKKNKKATPVAPVKKVKTPITIKKEQVIEKKETVVAAVKKDESPTTLKKETGTEHKDSVPVSSKKIIAADWVPNVNTTTVGIVKNPENTGSTGNLLKMEINNLGPQVNSLFPDYAPLISADGLVMVFTSRRPYSKKDIEKGKMGPENIYATYYDNKNKKWLVTFPILPPINTPNTDNSAISLSNDGQRMLLYRGGNIQSSNGDILESVLTGEEWSDPLRLPSPINSDDNETSASISPDGRTIYFVSDRKGGLGGRDIWYSTQDENGNWGEAVNMGPSINSPEDEEGVFIHPNGNTLFFSSKGHNSMGGYDIFMSVYDETTKIWSNAENLGAPLNTIGDDIYFTLAASGKTGYYASSKFGALGGPGDMDLYSIAFSEDLAKKNSTLLKGHVVNKNGNPVESIISIKNKLTGKLIGTFKSNKVTGKYLVSLPPGKKYEIEVSAKGYTTYTESIDIPYKTSYEEIAKDILLEAK